MGIGHGKNIIKFIYAHYHFFFSTNILPLAVYLAVGITKRNRFFHSLTSKNQLLKTNQKIDIVTQKQLTIRNRGNLTFLSPDRLVLNQDIDILYTYKRNETLKAKE